jgi:REP element-mobilizing transposase RayT
MSRSFAQLLCHFVFATRGRRELLTPQIRDRLYPYAASVLEESRGKVLRVGGTRDHIHILASLGTTVSVAEAMRDIKANTSRWLNEQFRFAAPFRWQERYGAFTVSWSARQAVCAYIDRQEEHHRKTGFVDELRRLLELHGVDFDERFLEP